MIDGSTEFYVGGSLLLVGICLAVVVADLLRDRSRAREVDAARVASGLSVIELAALRSGARGVGLIAVLELCRSGHLELTQRGRLKPMAVRVEKGSPFVRAAYTAVQRAREADLHDVRAAVRTLDETKVLFSDLVDRGLVRPLGARRQTGSDGQESFLGAVAVAVVALLLLLAPFVLLSVAASDAIDRPLDDDPGGLTALGAGAVMALATGWLVRTRTTAGRAVLRTVSAGSDELRAVAINGISAVADAKTRRALKRSTAPRYIAGGG